MLLGSCYTDRIFVTEYSDPFFYKAVLHTYTLYIRYFVKNFFYLKLYLRHQACHAPEYFRDYQQITFFMLNKFFNGSANPLPLTDNIMMDRLPTKIKWKIHALFTYIFDVLKVYTYYKNLEDTATRNLLHFRSPFFIHVDSSWRNTA